MNISVTVQKSPIHPRRSAVHFGESPAKKLSVPAEATVITADGFIKPRISHVFTGSKPFRNHVGKLSGENKTQSSSSGLRKKSRRKYHRETDKSVSAFPRKSPHLNVMEKPPPIRRSLTVPSSHRETDKPVSAFPRKSPHLNVMEKPPPIRRSLTFPSKCQSKQGVVTRLKRISYFEDEIPSLFCRSRTVVGFKQEGLKRKGSKFISKGERKRKIYETTVSKILHFKCHKPFEKSASDLGQILPRPDRPIPRNRLLKIWEAKTPVKIKQSDLKQVIRGIEDYFEDKREDYLSDVIELKKSIASKQKGKTLWKKVTSNKTIDLVVKQIIENQVALNESSSVAKVYNATSKAKHSFDNMISTNTRNIARNDAMKMMGKALAKLKLPEVCGNVIGDLCKYAELKSYKEGEYLYVRDCEVQYVFLLLCGKVELTYPARNRWGIIVNDSGNSSIVLPGDLLAQFAWHSGKPYCETARAVEDCYLIRISREVYEDVVELHERHKVDVLDFLLNKIPTLMKNDIGNDMNRMVHMCQSARCVQVPAKHVIIKKGDRIAESRHTSGSLYFILNGTCSVMRTIEHESQQIVVETAILYPRDFFGKLNSEDKVYNHTVVTNSTEVRLIEIAFHDIINTVSAEVLETMRKYLHQTIDLPDDIIVDSIVKSQQWNSYINKLAGSYDGRLPSPRIGGEKAKVPKFLRKSYSCPSLFSKNGYKKQKRLSKNFAIRDKWNDVGLSVEERENIPKMVRNWKKVAASILDYSDMF